MAEAEPESLLQPLPVELREQLESGPAAVREKVMAHEKVMVSQIKQFIKSRQIELLNMAEYELGRHKSEQRRQENEQRRQEQLQRTQSSSEPHTPKPALKSIVKHRPLRSEKRVSFSDSPPQVETFLDENDFSSSEDELQEPHTDPELSTEKAVDDSTIGDESADFDSMLDQDFKQPPPPTKHGQYDLEDPEFQPTIRDVPNEWRNETIGYTHEPRGPFKYDLQAIESPQDPTSADTGPSFSFDDIMDQDDTPLSSGGSAESDREEEPSPAAKHTEAASPPNSDRTRRYSHDLIVGSAPINIHLPIKGIDGDGGPIPASRLEQDEEEDISGTLPSIREMRHEIDSGKMSFSQRMVWEERHKP